LPLSQSDDSYDLPIDPTNANEDAQPQPQPQPQSQPQPSRLDQLRPPPTPPSKPKSEDLESKDSKGEPKIIGIADGGKAFLIPASTDALPDLDLPTGFTLTLDSPANGVAGGKKKVSMKDLLIFLPDGETPRSVLYNVLTVLNEDRDWKGALAFDEFSQKIITRRSLPWSKPVGGVWSDADDAKLASWLQYQKLIVPSSLAGEGVRTASLDHRIHPVRDYLKSLKWDGMGRIEGWLSRFMGVEEKPIVRAFASRWLISAVARVMTPGCQADHTLLLEGAQGTRKSTALRTLAGDGWFTDHISDLHDKDSRMELQGKWIVELSELQAVKGKGMEAVKSFLTTRVDSFRAPYSRYIQSLPRQCVFAATTNEQNALTDETGNRRFWPVHCEEIDIPSLVRERDQLWAEAFALWASGKPWWLETPELVQMAEKEQSLHYQRGEWDDLIMFWVEEPSPSNQALSGLSEMDDGPLLSLPGCVLISEIMNHPLRGKASEREGRMEFIIAKCLKANGWRMHQHGGENRGRRFWGPQRMKCLAR
jgi:putative DNA primase/helicase